MSAPIVLALLLTLGGATGASAQANPSVSYATGTFAWDAPVGGSTPTFYRMNCGAADVDFPAPATSKLINEVVGAPGTYTCTLKAGNAAGVSAPSNAITFDAVDSPNAPSNLRVQ